jgi:hypothetical protein
MPKRLWAMAACMLVLPLRLWCAQTASPFFEQWSMQDNFADGIPSWQSYPLAQDIGYDPSIYTTSSSGRSVLVRDVVNEGQQTQSVGLIRPIPPNSSRLSDPQKYANSIANSRLSPGETRESSSRLG